MSEYQYHEFLAIDRALSADDRQALRAISTRAKITGTSFSNAYEWGDLKGDPAEMVARWFDVYVYVANWGSRRLIIKLPARLLDRGLLDACIAGMEDVRLVPSGDDVLIDIERNELEFDDFDDGTAWLSNLAPLRAALLEGDCRLFYLLWLMGVEDRGLGQDGEDEEDSLMEAEDETGLDREAEKLAGIGPLTGAMRSFAEFFVMDRHLVEAAADRTVPGVAGPAPDAARAVIAAMDDGVKAGLLERLLGGDAHVAGDLRRLVRASLQGGVKQPGGPLRTVAELRARAEQIWRAEKRAAAGQAERKRQAEQEARERARDARIEALTRRGQDAWQDVEEAIGRRNAPGYEIAAEMIGDLGVIAERRGDAEGFKRRLSDIRARHGSKRSFIQRLSWTV